MAIEVFDGSNWVTVNDPEIFNGSSFVDVQKGEIFDGSNWQTFYNRFSGTVNTPTLELDVATISSIRVKVTLPTGSPYYTQVTVYRTDNALSASLIPSPAAVGAISGTKTETSLTHNTSYDFSAYASYYDSGGNLLAISSTVTKTFSTLDYTITTPTTPQSGTRTTTTLQFSAYSNANYVANGSYYTATPYVEFQLYQTSNNAFVQLQYAQLPLNDTLTQVYVTFTNLTSGVSYYCKARTYYYSPVSQYSSFSSNSASTTTQQIIATNTNLIASNNTTYLDSGGASGTNTLSGYPASRASDNNTTTEWLSDPLTSGTVGPVSVSVYGVGRSFGVAQYRPSSNFSGTPTSASVSSITYLRYDPIRYWTATAFGTTYTVLYLTTDPPVSINQYANIYSISSSINGTRQIVNKDTYGSYYRLTFVTSGAPASGSESNPTSSANGYVTIQTMTGNVAVSTLAKSLQTPYSATSTTDLYYLDSRSPNINFTKSNGSIAYYYSGSTSVGSGTEYLYVYFDPKQGTYPNPRMVSGTNVLSIKNGNQARTITASINGTSFGSLYFSAQQTRDFAAPSNISPTYDSFFGVTSFLVTLAVPRVDTGFGWFASIAEVQISYTYDTIS